MNSQNVAEARNPGILKSRNAFIVRVRTDERGMSFVFVGMGFMAFLATTLLAVDVGMFMTARSQAQNAADAGALAGAVAMVFDSYTNRSEKGPIVQNAIVAAMSNDVMAKDVSVGPEDVTFPVDENGEPNRVKVIVHRTGGRGNPLATLMGGYFGTPTASITAQATAEAAPANAATCVKPWAIPDKWEEKIDPPWDVDDTFDMYEKNGKTKLAKSDYYKKNEPGYTGFRPDVDGPDYGRRMVLKAGNPNQAISSSHFYPIALPPNTGASWYEENIPGCWPGKMEIGDMVDVEPGNMTGPTVSGTQRLIDKDLTAKWDPGAKKVISKFHPSPRVVVIPVFNPEVYEESRQHGRQDIEVANLVAFFIEELQGNDVVGYMVPATGLLKGTPVPSAYLRAIRLVQ
jgi:Flp pilus assembly protein TadG